MASIGDTFRRTTRGSGVRPAVTNLFELGTLPTKRRPFTAPNVPGNVKLSGDEIKRDLFSLREERDNQITNKRRRISSGEYRGVMHAADDTPQRCSSSDLNSSGSTPAAKHPVEVGGKRKRSKIGFACDGGGDVRMGGGRARKSNDSATQRSPLKGIRARGLGNQRQMVRPERTNPAVAKTNPKLETANARAGVSLRAKEPNSTLRSDGESAGDIGGDGCNGDTCDTKRKSLADTHGGDKSSSARLSARDEISGLGKSDKRRRASHPSGNRCGTRGSGIKPEISNLFGLNDLPNKKRRRRSLVDVVIKLTRAEMKHDLAILRHAGEEPNCDADQRHDQTSSFSLRPTVAPPLSPPSVTDGSEPSSSPLYTPPEKASSKSRLVSAISSSVEFSASGSASASSYASPAAAEADVAFNAFSPASSASSLSTSCAGDESPISSASTRSPTSTIAARAKVTPGHADVSSSQSTYTPVAGAAIAFTGDAVADAGGPLHGSNNMPSWGRGISGCCSNDRIGKR